MTRRPPRTFLATKLPLSFAHRGGSALCPENTLLAFRNAVEAGCDVLETDLRLTRDGQIVTLHDERLERTTNGRGPLGELSLAELRRLDAGYHFSPDGVTHPHRGQGLVVPTLQEVVELSDDLRLNVEIKPGHPGLVEALWSFIEQRGLHDRILVAAWHDRLLREFRQLSNGRVATSASFREVLWFWTATRLRVAWLLSPPFDALQVPVRHRGLTVVDERLVRAAHAVGIQVHVWTIDDPTELRRLLSLGVDGLMSDHPDRLISVVSERAG